MSYTYKEQQIETLFVPQTPDDHVVVNSLKSMDQIMEHHHGDRQHIQALGFLAGIATSYAMEDTSTFDGDFVDNLTNHMGEEFAMGCRLDLHGNER